MDRLVDHLFVFAGEGQIKDYPGNYSQYRDEKAMPREKEETSNLISDSAVTDSNNIPTARISYKEKREFEQLGKDIQQLTVNKAALTEKLNSEGLPFETLQQTALFLEQTMQELDQKELRWLELSEKIDSYSSK
jgi:ATP-binding cassette subfamily F protein uup